MKRWLLKLSSSTLALVVGCGDKDTEVSDYTGWAADYSGWVADDQDDDGSPDDEDCVDDNAEIHPGADEVCDDTLDNDCDGDVDAADADCAR